MFLKYHTSLQINYTLKIYIECNFLLGHLFFFKSLNIYF